MSSANQTYHFQAETKQLLKLMIHSLYSNREIFLRELVSNSSDAIDRLRFEALTNPSLMAENEKSEIAIEVDETARTLVIHDNGIGMSKDELVNNIGTIAKSGTRELMNRIKESKTAESTAELIGEFGVGFYSSFMVADKVSVVTRRAGENEAWRWESTGDGEFTIEPAQRAEHGTSITLYLKPADSDDAMEDFTSRWVISRVVKRYSDFIAYPIMLRVDRKPVGDAEDPVEKEQAETEARLKDKPINSMKPIWLKPASEVTKEEYTEFYKHIAHDWQDPLRSIPLKAEGRLEYNALLFIPSKAPYDLYYHAYKGGVRLYVKKVLIMERCEELLPHYLRFVRGVVDSNDLPLNVSRETLQHNGNIQQMKKWLTKKVLDALQEIQEKEPEKYREFWTDGGFGKAVKEGATEDFDNKERLSNLMIFESSAHEKEMTTLKGYVERMKPEQTEIYYLTGESRGQVENSPHLEAFKERGYEVLYFVDPVDELVTQHLTEFDGKRLKSIGKGEIELGTEEERKKAEEDRKEKEKNHASLLEAMQKLLDKHVKQVRLSSRLTNSPACLVGADHDYSPQMERLLQKGKGGGLAQRRILELNPNHPILAKLQDRFDQNQGDPVVNEYSQLLLGYGLLAEGSELPEPGQFNKLVVHLMEQAIDTGATPQASA